MMELKYGYVLLPKSVYDSELSDCQRRLFIYLLCKANHKHGTFKGTSIERGELATSINTLAEAVKMCERSVRDSIDSLVRFGEIEKIPDKHFTHLRLCNYDVYQCGENYALSTIDTATYSTTLTTTNSTIPFSASECEKSALCEQVGTTSATTLSTEGSTDNLNNKEINKEINNIHTAKPDYGKVISLFNSVCRSLPEVRKLTDTRRKAIRSLIGCVGEEALEEFFKKIESSDFLTGRTGSWNATFDWICKPSNAVKILEDNYQNRSANGISVKNKVDADYSANCSFDTASIADSFFDGYD